MKDKILKKILGVIGYKLIEKEVFKNERLLSSKSYLKIDKLLKVLFEDKKINNLIQVGANDGKRFDVLNYYIKKHQIKSLLVEPIKENFEQLKENYKNCDFVTLDNSAISVNQEINNLYKVNPVYIKNYSNHIPGITSFEKKHLLKHGVKKNHIITENVISISIADLIKKYNLNSFDLLYVDAEGYDGKIVIDFLLYSSLRPLIIFEYIHIDNKIFKELINLLISKKFHYFKINENLICFPMEFDNREKIF